MPKKQHAYAPPRLPRKTKLKQESTDPKASANLLLRARQQQSLKMLAEGHTPDQIAVELGARVQEVNQDIAKAADRLVKLYTCSPQHTFVRYAVFQLGIIRKLQAAVERFEQDPKTVQYNSIVAALRAQSDAYDRILDKGLSFGIIERKQATSAIRKDGSDIRNMLKTEILTLSRLLDEVDLSIEFSTARARIHARKQQVAIQQASIYTVIIRKPLVGPHGVIRAIPDWKYRTQTFTKRVSSAGYTASESAILPANLQLHKLSQEISKATQQAVVLPTEQAKQEQRQARLVGQQEVPKQKTAWLVSPTRNETNG